MTNIVTDTSMLTANNHELMKLVRARIEAQYPLGFIAQELDVEVQDLIDWIMDVYKAPPKLKRDAPLANAKYGPPIGQPKRATGWSRAASARLQSDWERQHNGAAEARRAAV